MAPVLRVTLAVAAAAIVGAAVPSAGAGPSAASPLFERPARGLAYFGNADASWGFHVRASAARAALVEDVVRSGGPRRLEARADAERLRQSLGHKTRLAAGAGLADQASAAAFRNKLLLSRPRRNTSLQLQLATLPPKAPKELTWKPRPEREFGGRRLYRYNSTTCTSHASCGENDYCMDCAKCNAFHESLPLEDQEKWTCDPCDNDEKICLSAAFCSLANDSIDGKCPESLPGCDDHSDCRQNEYCFSCEACQQKGGSDLSCAPCPTTRGGFCKNIAWCPSRQDAVGGVCPPAFGCTSHSDCADGLYCEGCKQCQDFLHGLQPEQRNSWSCSLCPTVGGGICEPLRFCQVANDGIDGTCPRPAGCDQHADCDSDEYCMGCTKCNAYQASLPMEQRNHWSCEPCPTARGGACELRQFCMVAQDGVTDTCPTYQGCAVHTDCRPGNFCLKWEQCAFEISAASCGAKPPKGGLCADVEYCAPGRSVDAKCNEAAPCSNNRDCNSDVGVASHFCTSWADCMKINPDICGKRSIHQDGVCLEVEHCARGLHAPIEGACPYRNATPGEFMIAEALRLNGSMMLATHHQAMNIWQMEHPGFSGTYAVAQLHEYGAGGAGSSVLDDNEYVGIFADDDNGILTEDTLVNLSCPNVETTIPENPQYFYEARMSLTEFDMSMEHQECSCIEGESVGACPRAVAVTMPPADTGGSPQCTATLENLTTESFTRWSLYADQIAVATNCEESVEFDTDLSITITPTAVSSPGIGGLDYTVRMQFYSMVTRRQDTFACGLDCVGVNLVFSGNTITCSVADPAYVDKCGTLPVNQPLAIVPLQIWLNPDVVSATNRHVSKVCVSCLRTLPRLYPVLFISDNGTALSNKLTIYTVDKGIKEQARLVDATYYRGTYEGDPELGCISLQPEGDVGPSIADLRSKALYEGSVTNKWCVVRPGGCPISAKYKLCVVSGAAGVLIMDDPAPEGAAANPVDKTGYVHVRPGETLADMVPLVYAVHDAEFWSILKRQHRPIQGFAGTYNSNWVPGTTTVTEVAGADGSYTATFSNDHANGSVWNGAVGYRAADTPTRLIVTSPQALNQTVLSVALTSLMGVPHMVEVSKVGGNTDQKFLRLEPSVAIGPWVGGRPRNSRPDTVISKGGVRSYNVASEQWKEHIGDFGGVHWMYKSPVRQVLFVCTSENKVVVLDTSRPDSGMRKLGEADGSFVCRRRSGVRDYHVVDVMQDGRFYTVEIDVRDTNRLIFYDTTYLDDWQYVTEVHASWEHETKGLGNVVASHDGKKLVITWHCDLLDCGDTGTSSGIRPGERLYVLGIQGLSQKQQPHILGIVQMPMTLGSLIRSVACNANDICLATLTWDGVVAVDIGEGLYRYEVIAQHSERFSVVQLPERSNFLKMALGAQKVYVAHPTKNRFYVERFTIDFDRLGNASMALSEVLRFDSVMVVDLARYARTPREQFEETIDPVNVYLYLTRGSMQEMLASLPTATVEFFQQVLHVTVCNALQVGSAKVEVLNVTVLNGQEEQGDVVVRLQGAKVAMRLVSLGGTPPTPEDMYTMLARQVKTPGSAIHRGILSKWMEGAQLLRQMDKASIVTTPPPVNKWLFSTVSGSGSPSMLALTMVLLVLLIVIATGALVYAAGQRVKAQTLEEEMVRIQQYYQNSVSGAGALPASGMPLADAIGRPASDAAGSAGGNFVVGMPLAAGASSAGVVGGTALSQVEAGKMGMPQQAQAPRSPQSPASPPHRQHSRGTAGSARSAEAGASDADDYSSSSHSDDGDGIVIALSCEDAGARASEVSCASSAAQSSMSPAPTGSSQSKPRPKRGLSAASGVSAASKGSSRRQRSSKASAPAYQWPAANGGQGIPMGDRASERSAPARSHTSAL